VVTGWRLRRIGKGVWLLWVRREIFEFHKCGENRLATMFTGWFQKKDLLHRVRVLVIGMKYLAQARSNCMLSQDISYTISLFLYPGGSMLVKLLSSNHYSHVLCKECYIRWKYV
jgi:hypothetical protein